MMSTFEELEERELEKLRHRGRAYQCTTCLSDEKKVVIMEKGRMEAHILKEHVAPARVPFRCSFCQFRCLDRATLDSHVTKYKPHGRLLKEAGGRAPENCLKESSCPYQIGETDYHVYSQEESPKVWYELKQIRAGARQSLSFLDGPVAETLTIQLDDAETILPPRTEAPTNAASSLVTVTEQPTTQAQSDQTLQLLSSLLNSGLLQLGPSFNLNPVSTGPQMLSQQVVQDTSVGHDQSAPQLFSPQAIPEAAVTYDRAVPEKPIPSKPLGTPVQDEIDFPSTWSPLTAFGVSLTIPEATGQTADKPDESSENADGPLDLTSSLKLTCGPVLIAENSRDLDDTPLDLSSKSERAEKPALPSKQQTAPQKSTGRSTEDNGTQDEGVEDLRSQLLGDCGADVAVDGDERRVGTISTPPRIVPSPGSPASSSSSGSTTLSDSLLSDIKNTITEGNRAMAAEIEKNSRAIRCLEKSMMEQTSVLRAMKESLETFYNYIRMHNREERRQAERRDEERKKERQEDLRRMERRESTESRERNRNDNHQTYKRKRDEGQTKENQPVLKSRIENKKQKK